MTSSPSSRRGSRRIWSWSCSPQLSGSRPNSTAGSARTTTTEACPASACLTATGIATGPAAHWVGLRVVASVLLDTCSHWAVGLLTLADGKRAEVADHRCRPDDPASDGLLRQ